MPFESRPDAAFDAALDAWRMALGPARVSTSPELLAVVNKATLASPTFITAVLVPENRAHVESSVKIATRFRVPVHPVSCGKNWGYGSRLPVEGGSVLLSLAAMDRVLHLDEAKATVRVEPGVTFRILADHLQAAGSQLLPPFTGSGPDTSVLGNVMEQGIGKGLYEDMAAHAAAFEVVLPSGEVLWTEGVGPDVRGLFTQSSLGVVTAMEFRLHPAPARRQLVWARLPDDAALTAFIDTVRPRLQHGDPWFRPELVTEHRAATQGVGGASGWLAGIWLWGDGDEDLAWRRRTAIALLDGSGGTDAGAGAVEAGASYSLGGDGLLGAYSAKPGAMPADPDPDRDGCGVRWVAPVLPMDGARVVGLVRDLAGIMAAHGFGPAMSLRALNGRTMKAVIGLFHDRDVAGGDGRAAAAAADLWSHLRREAIEPYRLGILDMAHPGNRGRASLLRTIKHALDPAGVLAPGRYAG